MAQLSIDDRRKRDDERHRRGLCVTCGSRPTRLDLRTCRKCADRVVRWRIANPDRVRALRLKNSDQYRGARRGRNYELRLAVIAAYGSKCECCEEDRLVFLAIDHIDGAVPEAAVTGGGKLGGHHLYRLLESQGWPLGYRVLCHNCNQATSHGRVCPHQEERDASS